jgi:hypothetical protein|tara:strand:- start:42363 stop:42812 length:450 start_codon:yes stop_codon:yes gene_type:complete
VTNWWEKPLDALTPSQWEALCDGCARCCLHKLEDADSGEVFYTRVSCRYLHSESCRCREYTQRSRLVADCMTLQPDNIAEALAWLPATCAYRLRARGEPLYPWHPLLSGDADSVHRAGISVRGRVVSEEHVHPDSHEEHIVRWVQEEPL